MEPKFRVGDRVKVTWQPKPNSMRLYAQILLDGIKKEQIIEEAVFIDESRIRGGQFAYHLKGKLYDYEFYDNEIELLNQQPGALLPDHNLPDI